MGVHMNLFPYRHFIDDDELDFLAMLMKEENPNLHEGNIYLVDKEYVLKVLNRYKIEGYSLTTYTVSGGSSRIRVTTHFNGAEYTNDLIKLLRRPPWVRYTAWGIRLTMFLGTLGWIAIIVFSCTYGEAP